MREDPHDRASATLQLVIILPGLLLLVDLGIGVGRTAIAATVVDAAARDAARQASIARDPASARTNALRSARTALNRDGLDCATAPTVSVEVSGLHRPVGTPSTVSARVTCHVRLSDLLLPGAPGTTTFTSTFSSPVDPYRGTAANTATVSLPAGGSASTHAHQNTATRPL